MSDGRPRLLDLFSGAGGAARGYQMAGFHVTGVDRRPQPRYAGDVFILGDALAYCAAHGQEYDAIHASPPCQAYLHGLRAVNQTIGRTDAHEDLIALVRHLLSRAGRPYVIENVPGAPLRAPVRLCGSSFRLPLRRHRLFESPPLLLLLVPRCDHAWQRERRYWTSFRPGGVARRSPVVQVYGHGGETDEWAGAMGIDWMTRDELSQAIPPAYTHYIGTQLRRYVD